METYFLTKLSYFVFPQNSVAQVLVSPCHGGETEAERESALSKVMHVDLSVRESITRLIYSHVSVFQILTLSLPLTHTPVCD